MKVYAATSKGYENTGEYLTLDDTQQASFFKNSDPANAKLLKLTKDGNTYYFDTDTGDVYTKDFVENGYKTTGYTKIEDAKDAYPNDPTAGGRIVTTLDTSFDDTFRVSDAFTNQGRLKTKADVTASGAVTNFTYDNAGNITGFKTDSGGTFTFKTVSQNIVTYNGDENLISMVKLNGATDPGADTVNSTGARMFGRDIFDNVDSGNEPSGTAMLNELLCVCEKVNTCDTHWMSSDGVGISDVAHATLVVEETRIGARQQLYQSVETMLEKHGDNITEDINNVSGTDIAELATKLMQLTTLYNMSLSMGGRILPQSLADYI